MKVRSLKILTTSSLEKIKGKADSLQKLSDTINMRHHELTDMYKV